MKKIKINQLKNGMLKLKTHAEIDDAIKTYKEISSDNYEEIKNKYFELFEFFPISAGYLEKKIIQEKLDLFRSRKCCEVKDKTNISEFSYPPLHIENIPTQRASWSGRNVLYASDQPFTALLETKLESSENEFFLAKWRFYTKDLENDKIRISSLAVGNLLDNNPWKDILMTQQDMFKTIRRYLSENDADLYSYLQSKISNLFTELGKSKYSLTAFIADSHIYSQMNKKNGLNFPILIYPSVANNYSCNFAIHPKFVDKYMTLEKVLKIKIIEEKDNKIKYEFSEIGIPNSKEKIIWYNIKFEDSKRFYSVESIKYGCSETINTNNIEELIFQTNDGAVNIGILISKAIELNDQNYNSDLENILELDGLPLAIESPFTYNPPNTKLIANEKEYSDLTIRGKIIQWLSYIEAKT